MRTMRRKHEDLVMTQEVRGGEPSTAWKATRCKGVGLRTVRMLLMGRSVNFIHRYCNFIKNHVYTFGMGARR